jgi:hypothetical protein
MASILQLRGARAADGDAELVRGAFRPHLLRRDDAERHLHAVRVNAGLSDLMREIGGDGRPMARDRVESVVMPPKAHHPLLAHDAQVNLRRSSALRPSGSA